MKVGSVGNNDLKKQIGENIRRIRLNNNVEVKQLCSCLKISAATYSNIERGVTDINISRVIQLAEYFKIHYSQIITHDNITIDPFTQPDDDTFQLNPQMADIQSVSYLLALQQLKSENDYLKMQINKLLEILSKK